MKMLKLIASCGECPNYGYYSGGTHECRVVNEVVPDKTVIASFCPLPDFPSRQLAAQESTIRLLREPNTYGLVLAVFSHIATKLKTTVNDNGTVAVPLKDGTVLYVHWQCVTELSLSPGTEVHFVSDKKKYKLHPDAHPPVLYEEVTVEGHEGPLWTRVDLA